MMPMPCSRIHHGVNDIQCEDMPDGAHVFSEDQLAGSKLY